MLSIIIPAHNAQSTISRCLDSIIRQKGCELEIIIINDRSTDRTGELLSEYQKKYSNIKIINKNVKTSISDVRNYGLKVAEGEYITFVDADDTITDDPGFYKRCIEIVKDNDCDALFFGYNIIRKGKIIPCPIMYDNKQGCITKASKADVHSSIASYHPFDVNGYVWKAIFRKSPILMPIGFSSYEDMFYLHQFVKTHSSFFILNEIGYNYYINSNSFVHGKDCVRSVIKDSSSIVMHRMMLNMFPSNEHIFKHSTRTILKCSVFSYLHATKTKEKNLIRRQKQNIINSLFRKQKTGKLIIFQLDLRGREELYLATVYSLKAQRYNSYLINVITDSDDVSHYFEHNLCTDGKIRLLHEPEKGEEIININCDMVFSYDSVYQLSLLKQKGKPIRIKTRTYNLSDIHFLFPTLTPADEKQELKEISFYSD